MDLDDLEPVLIKKEKKNLEVLSVEALHEYIVELKKEIERVKEVIVSKKSAHKNADTFFK